MNIQKAVNWASISGIDRVFDVVYADWRRILGCDVYIYHRFNGTLSLIAR